MTATVMVIVEEQSEMARQTGLVENDDVVQALAPNRADHALDVGSLPGRARCRKHLFDSHGLDLLHKLLAEDPVPVAQQIAGCGLPGKGFPQLVRGPLGGRMSRDRKMQDATSMMRQHEKYVEDLKADRGHGE